MPLSLRLVAPRRRADRARAGAGAAEGGLESQAISPSTGVSHASFRALSSRSLASRLAGCSNFRDLFSAHADVAAEAGGLQLPAAAAGRDDRRRTRAGASASPGRRRTSSPTRWVDYALFGAGGGAGQAADRLRQRGRGGLARDLAELKGTHCHDTLMAPPGRAVGQRGGQPLPVAPTCACSSTSCSARSQRAAAGQRTATRKKAEATLVAGSEGRRASAQLASQLSEDPGQPGRQRVPAAQPQGPVRRRVRQRRLGAAAGPGERRGGDAVRLPHHPAPAAGRGARATRRLSRRAGRRRGWIRSSWTAWRTANKIEVAGRRAGDHARGARTRRTSAAAPSKTLAQLQGRQAHGPGVPALGARAAAAVLRAAQGRPTTRRSAASPGCSPRTCCSSARPTPPSITVTPDWSGATLRAALPRPARHAQDGDGTHRSAT